MSAVVVSLILLGVFCAVFRLLHLSIYAGEPKLFYKEGSQFVKSVLDLCPIFKEVFTNIVCKYGGATHDAYILANSSIPEIMDQLPGGGWLLGDSGYPLRPWLMTPFLTPQAGQQEKYNASHIKTRNCVERAFGVLKSRFRYLPPLIWGKSGHLQTLIYAKLGRVKSPYPQGERISVKMSDGATMTFDVFEPHKPHPTEGDYTMVLCPGIANSSETTYICTFVHYAQERGYRVAVLNHLGALSSAPLTSSRMFTYGGTEEYGAMVDEVLRRHPDTRLMGVGFSMGGNVVVKYVGEDISRQEKFLCLMSLCQGYDAEKAIDLGKDWAHLRRMYAYVMTSNQKKMLRRHYDMLLGKEVQEKYNIDPELVLASTTLYELDEAYSRRRAGFESVEEYHIKHSCRYYMDKITLPMFLLNATDDPLVPPPLVEIGIEYAKTHPNSILVETRHGGHLGFFESGILTPDPITWLDRSALQYAEAIVTLFVANSLPHLKLKAT